MNDFWNSLNSLRFSDAVSDIAWQSTIVLACGLLVARFWIRQPARSHAVLTLAFVATLTAPIASHLVRQTNWGLLPPVAEVPAMAPAPVAAPLSVDAALPADTASSANTAVTRSPVVAEPTSEQDSAVTSPSMAFTAAEPRTQMPAGNAPPLVERPAAPRQASDVEQATATVGTETHLGWRSLLGLFLFGWLAAALIGIGRLALGAWAGTRLVAKARPCTDAGVLAALAVARWQLGLQRIAISIDQTDAVRCPVIWCWGRRPRVLVPSSAVREWTVAQWSAVLCHELAHLKRRDHWAALLSETTCALLPWQPLAWWTKRQLETASEQACDDWTVAAGHSAVDYAETLLDLVSQAGPPLALAALRRPSGTAGRIRHILTQAVPRPRRGWAWGLLMLFVASLGVGATALCQRGVLRAEPPAPAMKGRMAAGSKAGAPALENGLANDGTPRKYKAHGRLLKPDGQPMPGADVIWEIVRRLPGGNRKGWEYDEVARTQTDGQGRFACEAELIGRDVLGGRLIFRATEFGLMGYSIANDALDKLGEPIEVQLQETYPIDGTIFTPNGEPVPDAQVVVSNINNYLTKEAPDPSKQWYLSIPVDELNSSKPRDYWPAPVTTDAEGRFSLVGIVPRSATTELVVTANDYVKTRVHVAHPDSQRWEGTSWREPNFTLVLEPPFVVEGRFTDEKTGRPIADTKIEVMATMNSRGFNRNDAARATSDADGRYRLLSGSGDFYHVKILPPLGYPGVNTSFNSDQVKQLAGKTRKIKYPVRLRPGLVLSGRVIDATSGEGVADADVLYQPAQGRKFGTNSDFTSVKTSADGSFELTGADGKGTLLVDAPEKGFYRLLGDDKTSESQYYREMFYPHGTLAIDVPANGQQEPLVVSLQHGPELAAQVVAPDGKPVKKMMVAYRGLKRDSSLHGEAIFGSLFRIDAVEPGRMYRVAIYAEDSQSGKVVELTAPADGKPLEIKLDPCATIRGRYVYDGSVPAPEVTNFSHFSLNVDHQAIQDDKIFQLPFYDNFARQTAKKRVSDENGDFELTGIVPGLFMYLCTNYRFLNGKTFQPLGPLGPGETRDVGELVIQP